MKRNEGESFEDFKKRRAMSNKIQKFREQGRIGCKVWDVSKNGSHVNPKKKIKRLLQEAKDEKL